MNEIIRYDDTMAEWETLRAQAEILVKTKFLPKAIETAEQALAIILTGRELGVGVMASLRTINVIQGQPTIAPQLMLALINRTKELEDLSITDNGQACTVTMKRRGMRPQSATFSMKDAQAMKAIEYVNGEKKTIALAEKYNWRAQPAVMRQWRAIAACARKAFPDVILGLYTPDEMGAAADEPGEIIDAGEPENFETPAAEPEPEKESVDYGKGLDQWKCGRRIAMRILDASTKLKALGASEDTIRRWLPEGVTSRKDLEAERATDFLYNLNLRMRLMQLCRELTAAGATGDEIRKRLPDGVLVMRDLSVRQVVDVYRDFTRWLAERNAEADASEDTQDEFIN